MVLCVGLALSFAHTFIGMVCLRWPFHKLIPVHSLLITDVNACHLNSPKDNQQVRDKIKSFCCQSCFYLSLVVRSCTFLSRYSRRNSTTHNRWLTKLIISPTIKYRVSPLHVHEVVITINLGVCQFRNELWIDLSSFEVSNALFFKAIIKRGSHRNPNLRLWNTNEIYHWSNA